MDDLREILRNFNQEDINSFKTFCQRKKLKTNRKDLILLDFLLHPKQEPKEVFILKQYEKVNAKSKEAYFTLRKKLYSHLQDFVITRERANDISGSADIMGQLALAQYLFKENLTDIAWKHLNKAENIALKKNNFSLLKNIYLLQIEYAHCQENLNITEIIQKKILNDRRIETEENFLIAQSTIKHSLYTFRKDGKNLNINELVTKTLKKHKIKEELLNSPKLTYILLDIIRTASISTKQYHNFLPVIEYHFKNLFEGFGFDTSEQLYKVRILYMYLHTLYRNKEFAKCLNYFVAYQGELEGINKSHYYELYPKFKLLYAACLNHTNQIDKAVAFVNQEIDKGLNNWAKRDRYNLFLNHIVYTHQQEDLAKLPKLFIQHFNHSDNFVEKAMGKEWLLKKMMIEVLIQYDMENYDIAESLIRSIERKFKPLFEMPLYSRVRNYLKLIKIMISKPHIIKEDTFENMVEEAFEWKPLNEEDLQAVGFYSWIKAKRLGKGQYEMYMELVKVN